MFRSRGRWIFARSFQENGKRVRRSVSAATREEVIALAALRTDWGSNVTKYERAAVAAREAKRAEHRAMHAGDHSTGRERNERANDYATRVVDMGIQAGWTPQHIAAVVIAQLTPNRVRRSIFGPCAYCGSWFATEVDHVIPVIRGGTDGPENLTSACKPCNSKKRTRTPEEWRIAS